MCCTTSNAPASPADALLATVIFEQSPSTRSPPFDCIEQRNPDPIVSSCFDCGENPDTLTEAVTDVPSSLSVFINSVWDGSKKIDWYVAEPMRRTAGPAETRCRWSTAAATKGTERI